MEKVKPKNRQITIGVAKCSPFFIALAHFFILSIDVSLKLSPPARHTIYQGRFAY
jgi:hypothetical protein